MREGLVWRREREEGEEGGKKQKKNETRKKKGKGTFGGLFSIIINE